MTASGQDLTSSGNRAHWEEASTALKPSTPTRKPPKPENAITICVSARVLFNMEKEQLIYEQQGLEEYVKYQVEHETQPFSPGPAFSFVKVRETNTDTQHPTRCRVVPWSEWYALGRVLRGGE